MVCRFPLDLCLHEPLIAMQLSLCAAHILQQVLDEACSLDKTIVQFGKELDGSLPALKELSFGACRYYCFYNDLLTGLLAKPLKKRDRIIHFLLVTALYQLDHMSIPDHAVVNETVDSVKKMRQKWAKGLVNGVLRKYLREHQNSQEPIGEQCFPRHLVSWVYEDWPDHVQRIMKASNTKPPLTLRVNQQKSSRDHYLQTLSDVGIKSCATPDSRIGVTLENPVNVEEIPGFSDGVVSVQDESAQLIIAALDLQPGHRVLDGCAAPGGKTALIFETQPELDELIAVDLPHRTSAINENIRRIFENSIARITLLDADLLEHENWWDGGFFDRILLDVPCSGTGVMRRHPDIRHRRRQADINQFHDNQFQLLESAWNMLKPGGVMLYVTCSILRKENDRVIEKFMGQVTEIELQSLDSVFGIETACGRQRLPGIHSGDGFYYCKIGKRPSAA